LKRPGDFLARLRPRKPLCVKPEAELLSQLRALCGEEAVSLVKQG
jgi:hypothetical protein